MLRFGIIGAGRIAHVHARAIGAHPEATVSVVADIIPEGAKALADAYGARATQDVDSVFTADDVDAVVICSPTPLHVPHIRAAVAAGKPALCEKPIAMDTKTTNELLKELEGKEYSVAIGLNRRFDPSFRAIHDRVEAGEIGKVEQVTIISRDPAAPPKSYIAVSGGIFKDMTIHDLDMARFFLGEIKSVTVVPQNMDPDLADTGDFDGAVLTLKNAEGAVATIINSRHSAPGYDQRLEVFGPKGSLQADNIRATSVQSFSKDLSAAQDPYLDFFLDRYADAYAAEIDNLIQAVKKGERPTPSLEDGAKALLLAEAADEAARTGKTVEL